MAFTTKFSLLILVLLQLLFVAITPASALCTTRHGCFFSKAVATNVHNRKVIYYELEKRKVGFNYKGGATVNSKNEEVVEWDLRRVPSGPDPLHHNGGNPKKPRTP